ncbi:MAG: hypothetical protein ABR549_07645 [Mycobacteriales bacterium]
MARVVKKSLSFPQDLFEELEAEARAQDTTVSALVSRATASLIRRERGLRAVADWEAEHGAFTEEELAEADRILDEHGV